MTNIVAFEAKTNLSKYLERVKAGQLFTITKHGVPIARLCPTRHAAKRDIKDVIRDLRQFRASNSLGDITIKELINQGRR